MKAFEAINPDGAIIYVGQTIRKASRLLIDKGIIAAAVFNSQNHCLGVVSKDMLLNALLQGMSAETDVVQIMRREFNKLDYDDEIVIDYNKLHDLTLVEKEGIPAGVIDYPYMLKMVALLDEIERAGFYASVDAVFTPVLAVDNDNRVKIINKWMARVLDIDKDKALHANVAEVIHDQRILTLLNQEQIYSEEKINLKENTYIPYSKDILIDKERIGRVILLRNVSEIEQLVKESEYTKGLNSQLEAIIESSFDGLYLTDAQANTLRINNGFERIMGITAEQCVGRNMVDLVAEGVFSRSGTLAAMEQGGRVTLSLTSSTGKEALVTTSPIYDDEENLVFYVTNVRDITELNELERKLEHVEGMREKEMEAVIESMFDGLYVTDGQANTLRINKGFEIIMGITAEQCVGRNMRDLVREGVFSRSGTLVALETGQRATIALTSSTGKEALVTSQPIYDNEGNIIMVITNVRDITELNELQRRLEKVEGLRKREMEAIIESMFDGLYVTDGQANTLMINKGFERIMGITAGQCVGRSMKDLVRDGVFSRSGTLVALETGARATISLTSSTGKEALVTSNPIYDDEGNIIMVVTNVRDITELNELERRLERVEGLQELYKTELEQMKMESSRELIMTSAKMKELVGMVIRIAGVDSTVLIQGESGVGKELIAEIIHSNSKCKDGPFVRVNCGAIPENLLESELFGYEGGAFTGANKSGKPGLFELAKGGIIFLDEIGELPLSLQVKLLRVLQDRMIMRVGGIEPIKIDCRILAGTNRDLKAMIEQHEFRLDLFYRLNVIPVTIPPLRERPEDIPVLISHFLKAFNRKYDMRKLLDTGVYNTLADYSWPGNVRELENLIERLVVTCINNTITVNDLPSNILTDIEQPQKERGLMPLKEALENTERELLEKAFSSYRSSYQIAEVLKINQSTVIRKAQKYGIKH